MYGIAVLPAAKAAATYGLGLTLPAVSPSVASGFAAGTLLSGLCLLLASAPRRQVPRRGRQQNQQPRPARRQAGPQRAATPGQRPQSRRGAGRHAAPSGAAGRLATKRVSRLV